MPRIQFSHQTVPTETTLHLGPHGHVDAVFLQALCDPFSSNMHDVGLGDALCGSSSVASHHCDTHRFSSLCSHNRVLLILRLIELSQSRSSFRAQEQSVSLGKVIPLVFLPRAAPESAFSNLEDVARVMTNCATRRLFLSTMSSFQKP